MAQTIKLRRGTAAQWTTANPTLAAGEQGLETDSGLIKVGDGTTAWTTLGYLNVGKMLANVQTANYTVALSDVGKVVEVNSANVNLVTVPANATTAFKLGSWIDVYQAGAGQTVISPASGVTLRSPSGTAASGQYATIRLRQRATNEWVLSGNLSTALIPFADSFPTDSTTTMGLGWSYLAGTWGVTGGKAYSLTGSGFIYAVHDAGTADVTIQVTASTLVTGGSGISFRMVDANNGLALVFNDSGGKIQLYTITNGSYSPFSSVVMAVASGDIFKLTALGSNLTVYRNGTSVLTATNSSSLTGTKHGLWAYDGTVSSTNRSWDDFSIVGAS